MIDVVGTLPEPRSTPAVPAPLAVRNHLTNMRALLVLSILMTESADEDQILNLAASSASSLGAWTVSGFAFTDPDLPEKDRWRPGMDLRHEPLPADLAGRLAALPDSGGDVGSGENWAWAFPLRTAVGQLGFLVASANRAPEADDQFLMQVLAQQTGVAVLNARLHTRERAGAEALALANRALEETVATLRRGMQIHERLTAVAAAGEGFAGIAQALHELTALPVAIEDRYGNLRAWAGPGRPEPYPKPDRSRRNDLLRRLVAEGRSVREGKRVVALASPRPDVIGFISLIDPERVSDASDLVALEHCATVLAVELARLRGLADAELRLRRELLQDLLTGTDNESALARAEALGYDLGQPHRVLLLDCAEKHRSDDETIHAARRALRELRLIALLGTQGGRVVIVVPDAGAPPGGWDAVRRVVMRELGGTRCRLAVGNAYPRPGDLPQALREAQLALRLQEASGMPEQTTTYAELGVFRMFAAVQDIADVEDFARRWLEVLIGYDQLNGTELVKTLTHYLDHGGQYGPTTVSLSVHRSTLKYRLRRIRELSSLDLADPETLFNLQLATRAWTTLRALREQDSAKP